MEGNSEGHVACDGPGNVRHAVPIQAASRHLTLCGLVPGLMLTADYDQNDSRACPACSAVLERSRKQAA